MAIQSSLFVLLFAFFTLLHLVVATPIPYRIGYTAKDNTSTLTTIEGWLGRPLDMVGTTTTMTAYCPSLGTTPSRYLNSIAVPMLSIPGWDSLNANNLSAAATGSYDNYYTNMANSIASAASATHAVRLGWEMNGNWYPWSVGNSDGVGQSWANYQATFQRMAGIFRSKIPGVQIEFCVNYNSVDSGTPLDYYPGDSYVDIVSMDIYESEHGNWPTVQSSGTYNLDWLVSFAQSHGKKVALSEWGAGSDDGSFITSAASWMNSLGTTFDYQVYSQYSPADQVVQPGQNPNEQNAWISAWRNTSYSA